MRIGRRVAVLGMVSVAALASAPAHAAVDVPPMQQTLLAFRVLAYDRNLKTRAGDVATIAILFKAGDRDSEETRDAVAAAMVEAAKSTEIAGLAVKIVRVAYSSDADFEKVAGSQKLAAAYVCPGMNGEVGSISKIARAHSILTLTPTEQYVDSGLGVGLVKRGAKPTVLVNLPAARAEGTDLDAALLSLAEVKR